MLRTNHTFLFTIYYFSKNNIFLDNIYTFLIWNDGSFFDSILTVGSRRVNFFSNMVLQRVFRYYWKFLILTTPGFIGNTMFVHENNIFPNSFFPSSASNKNVTRIRIIHRLICNSQYRKSDDSRDSQISGMNGSTIRLISIDQKRTKKKKKTNK